VLWGGGKGLHESFFAECEPEECLVTNSVGGSRSMRGLKGKHIPTSAPQLDARCRYC